MNACIKKERVHFSFYSLEMLDAEVGDSMTINIFKAKQTSRENLFAIIVS